MGDVVRGFLEGSVQLASQGRLGRIPPGLDERQGFPEVLRFGEGSCLRELVLDRGRIDLHLPARVDEGLAFRQLLADVRLQQAEAPIDAPREGGPRPFDLAGLEGDLPFLEELLELRRIGADLVSRLEEPLGLVPDVLHLFQQDPEIGDRVRRADRLVERLHVVPIVVHPPGIGDERGDGERPLANRPELPLDGLDGLFRHPLLKADAFGFLFALLGRRDRLAVLLRPEELARPFEQPLRGSGVRPVHPGAEEVLFEALHPRGDPAVPFLRCLGFGLRGVVKGKLIASASVTISRSRRRAVAASSPWRLRRSSCSRNRNVRSAACSSSPASRCWRARTIASLDCARFTPSTEPRTDSAAVRDEVSFSLMSEVNSSSARCASANALSYSFAFMASFAAPNTSRRWEASIPILPASSRRPRDERIRCADEYRTVSLSVSARAADAIWTARSYSRRSNAFFASTSISTTFDTSTLRFFASATNAAPLAIALYAWRWSAVILLARSFASFSRRRPSW